jgi:glycosyltransferase involved in cell wall biosynthesis
VVTTVPVPISVVVCTRNRLDSLQRCVRALCSTKTDHEWELVIVDNGSEDRTSSFLASLPERFGNVSVVATFETKSGLASARNKGVSQARGNIVAFTDDDCYVAADYIDAMISAFATSSEIGFIGGRVLPYDHSDLTFTIQEREDYLVLKPRTFIEAGTIHGANMAFRKTVLDRIGGFDERLGAGTKFGSGEDIDAAASALWAGITGAYDPRPTVYHHDKRKTSREARELWKVYDKGRGAYYAKYLLRSDSRSEYLRKWMGSIKREVIAGSITGRLWNLRKVLRELSGASHYVAARVWIHLF